MTLKGELDKFTLSPPAGRSEILLREVGLTGRGNGTKNDFDHSMFL